MPGKKTMPADKIFTLKDFYFHLPDNQIAQYPAERRSESRLFILNRNTSGYQHKKFSEIQDFLNDGDLLVLNNAKVIPARIFFKRKNGGLVEIVLTQRLSKNNWLVISNRTKKLKNGEILSSSINPSVQILVNGRVGDYLQIETECEFTEELLKEIGKIPLPPYIKREPSLFDEERYQTVYAKDGVAAAAPTAGLHFTDELISELKKKGVIFTELTLDVSWGTFQPVRHDDLSLHKMHVEHFSLSDESVDLINKARVEKRRIVAVGTTALRVLESTFRDGFNISCTGDTGIFIYPPYKVKSIDAIITNFHTPFSTLLMLVASFAGYEKIIDAYKVAVEKNYRFFSYGDAMLIL